MLNELILEVQSLSLKNFYNSIKLTLEFALRGD